VSAGPSAPNVFAVYLTLAVLAGVGCRDAQRVEISAGVNGTPLAGASVTIAPYNPRHLLDSLAALSATPQPTFPGLDSALRAFSPGADSGGASPDQAWQATRDSTLALSDSLRGRTPRSPGYRDAYQRFRALYERLAQRSARRDAAYRQRTAGARDLADRAARAADSLRAWEKTAYEEYPAAAESALARRGRSVRTVVTDSSGHADVELPRGDWWLVLRVPDPENPFLEYRWHVGVRVTPFPVRVPLLPLDAEHVWRH